jgi:hypothetical protein
MGYKPVDPTVYVVSWDADRVVKVGYSDRQRWRPFVIRGGRLVSLTSFDAFMDASNLEQDVHAVLRRHFRGAFGSARDAVPYLGSGGSGYLECYRMHPRHADALLSRIAKSDATPPCTNERTGRTYVLTNGVVPSSGDIFPVRYAHTRPKAIPR